jgi:SAM-dependent methyltransferase
LTPPSFDSFRDSYEQELRSATAFSGQTPDVFLEAKADHLVDLADRLLGGASEAAVLDVGCGPGLMDRHLVGRVRELQGVDVAPAMVEAAAAGVPEATFTPYGGGRLPFPDGRFDVSFASCVVHHVPLAERDAFAGELARVTRPGGLTVLFEHNPANPLTRLVVHRCTFDDEDVILLPPRESVDLLARAAGPIAERRFILFFPWRVRPLVAAERRLARLPFGAQYYVAARVGS